MIIYELTFSGAELDEDEKKWFLDDADTLFNVLQQENKICSRDVIINFGADGIKAVVDCPEEEVIFRKENNFYPQQWINIIKEKYNLEISIEKIGESPLKMGGSYTDSTAFILHGDGASPLCSFNDFKDIPLYEFPYTYHDGLCYNDINWWHRDYSQLFSLWFRGKINEEYCHEMLSSISSPLTEQGLEICRKIERLTGKDCYYYLFNHYYKLNGESCPSCGEPWKLSEAMFGEYDHRCDTCKIISKTGFEE